MLSPTAPLPPSVRHQVARAFLILCGFVPLAASFAMCTCPEFFAFMALFAALAFWLGSRRQRMWAAALFVVAVIVGSVEFTQERRRATELRERARKLHPQAAHPAAGA